MITPTRSAHRCAALAMVAAVAMGLVACGGDTGSSGVDVAEGGATATATSAPSATMEVLATDLHLDLVGCHQFGTNTGVDPGVALTYVPDDEELYLDADGLARFAFVAKSCDDIVVDGTSQGPGHFNTAWIRIVGPEETRTAPGGSPAVGPTDYFVPILLQTDNDGYAAATQAFGVPMARADELAFGPSQPGVQTGSGSDGAADPPVRYRWTVDNVNASPLDGALIVHVLQGRSTSDDVLTYDIECIAAAGFLRNAATFEVEPGSAFEDLVGSGFDGPGNGPDINCTVDIARS